MYSGTSIQGTPPFRGQTFAPSPHPKKISYKSLYPLPLLKEQFCSWEKNIFSESRSPVLPPLWGHLSNSEHDCTPTNSRALGGSLTPVC